MSDGRFCSGLESCKEVHELGLRDWFGGLVCEVRLCWCRSIQNYAYLVKKYLQEELGLPANVTLEAIKERNPITVRSLSNRDQDAFEEAPVLRIALVRPELTIEVCF